MDPKAWRRETVHEVALAKGCWIWTGCTDKHGYGLVFNPGGPAKSHRAVFDALKGPTELLLHHLCGVKSCFNPSHLLPVGSWAHQYLHGGVAIDRALLDKCRMGHPLLGDNLGLYKRKRGNIERKCMTCKRADSLRRYREAHRGQ